MKSSFTRIGLTVCVILIIAIFYWVVIKGNEKIVGTENSLRISQLGNDEIENNRSRVELLAVSDLDRSAVLKFYDKEMLVVYEGQIVKDGEFLVQKIVGQSVLLKSRLKDELLVITKDGSGTSHYVLSSTVDYSEDLPLITN